MKKIILLITSMLFIVFFTGCDTSIEVKKNNTVLITIECDEDEVDEYGQWYDFDEGDLDSKSDLEDILEDLEDELEDYADGKLSIKSFKRKRDDFTIVLELKYDGDKDDVENGFALGNAQDILDSYSDYYYDDDFEDVYDKDLSEHIDDEITYAFDSKGRQLSDKDFEKYSEKTNFKRLEALFINSETEITVPGKIQLVISDYEVDIDESTVAPEYGRTIIVYKESSILWLVILLLIVGAVAAIVMLMAKNKSKSPDNNGASGDSFIHESSAKVTTSGVCPNCNSKIKDTDTFCKSCGYSLKS